MEDREFARQLCAWLDPAGVAQAAAAHDVSREYAGTSTTLTFPRRAPGEARAIGLDVLVDKFLRGFELSGDAVELLAPRYPRISAEAWEWVSSLRFEGSVAYEDFPAGEEASTIMKLTDRFSLAFLVRSPIEFLIQETARLAPTWSVLRDDWGDFYEPSVYTELPAFIECAVATALGHAARLRSAQLQEGATVLYGDGAHGFSTVGAPPFAKTEATRELYDTAMREQFKRYEMRLGLDSIAADPGAAYDFGRVPPGERPRPGESDGFVAIDPREAAEPWRNVSRWRDEHSPYSIMRSRGAVDWAVDSYYGRVYDFPLEGSYGVYGITEAMPTAPWARTADGFLRTPFRKVPRYVVRDRAELGRLFGRVAIIGDGSETLYRGQPGEYSLPRSASTREILYGDPEAIEPSLLASSVRSARPLETVLPEWCLLVRQLLETVWEAQLGEPAVQEAWPIVRADAARLRTGLDLHLYAISQAQHYGLPTMGLDVTTDIDTALFFALHEIEREPGTRTMRYRRKEPGSRPGVLYLLAPDERFRLIHDRARPRTTGAGRPERQKAHFLITGWGHHRNAAARHLALAISLDPAGDWGALPSPSDLFPAREEDLFGNYLESRLESGDLPAALREYVEQLYWVAAS